MKASPYLFLSCPFEYSSVCSNAIFMKPSRHERIPATNLDDKRKGVQSTFRQTEKHRNDALLNDKLYVMINNPYSFFTKYEKSQ